MKRKTSGLRCMNLLLPLASLCLLASGCGTGGMTAAPAPTPAPTPTPTPAPTPTPTVLKAPLHGLLSMGDLSFVDNPAVTPNLTLAEPNADGNVYVAAVIPVTWKQLQPTTGSTLDTSAIESALANIATYNAAHPGHPMVGKLRVFAGLNTPGWAMNLDGAPITLTDSNGNTGVFPRFWTANYVAAWKALQSQLAAIYDKDTRLGEVAVSGCSSTTAEPFLISATQTSIPILKNAGYTDTQMKSCLSTMGDQYSSWTITPVDYTFNPIRYIDSGVPVSDTVFPIQVMTAWRSTLGTARGVIANHGLQPAPASGATPIYSAFTTLGPPLEFQTVSPTVDWPTTIAEGLTFHPTEIEIWNTTQAGGQAVITLAQLQLWAGEI